MPPLPKKQLSKSKQRSRASHFKSSATGHSICDRCHSPKLPHHVCPTCGFYKGRGVLAVGSQNSEA